VIELLAGAALGLAGSAHCAAMCGPLVVAVGRGAGTDRRVQLRHALTYHAGRVLLYLCLGVVAGAAGRTLTFAGLGRGVSIGAGLLLIAAALARQRVMTGRLAGKWSSWIAQAVAATHRWGARRPVLGPLFAGAVNGLLPCGLTYAALTAAVALGTTMAALAFMTGFGLGTVPVLLVLSMTTAAVPQALRARLRRLAPMALAILGALLVTRGLMSDPHAPAQGDPQVAIHAH
jgi:sulfite exporter TauE/SafE